MLHTSGPPQRARFKHRYTHKPFWRPAMTYRADDDPITWENRQFIEQVKRDSYVNTRLTDDEGVANGNGGESPLRADLAPWPWGEWQEGELNIRTGVIGRKIGVTPLWLKSGRKVMCTMVQVEDNHVIRYDPPEKANESIVMQKKAVPIVWDRNKSTEFGRLLVGALSGNPEKYSRAYCGLFTETGLVPKKKLTKFRVTGNAVVQPGTQLRASHFQPGQYVDILGRSMRRGFQGVMKRWGFSGMPADKHGTTKSHRRPGCIGSGRDKSRVWPLQKMPGHMGGDRVWMSGLRVLRINYQEDVLYIMGLGVPGDSGEFVYVQDTAHFEKRLSGPPRFFPTCYPDQHASLPEEEYADDVHRFEDPSIVFADDDNASSGAK